MRPPKIFSLHPPSAPADHLAHDLQASEERLRLALQGAGGGVWDWDLVSTIAWWSPEMYELWGMPPGTPMQLENSLTHIHEDDRERVQRETEAAIASRQQFYCEFRLCPPGRSERWIASRGRMICDDEGNATRMLGISLDITERKRAEEERRRLEARVLHSQKLESLGLLAGGIAHDFNNLLLLLGSYASLAQEKISHDSPAAPLLHEIQIAVQRAADLTNQLLAYAGKGETTVAPLRLEELVREMCCLLHARLPSGARLEADFRPATIQGDATQIRQVVMNLISNASDALGSSGGKIRVSTCVETFTTADLHSPFSADDLPAGDYACIEVTDNGCGMSTDTVQRIFEPFFTTKPNGRGLGIAAVLGIVRGHHGVVQVKSAVGEGTTFKILLPACTVEIPQQTPRACVPQKTEKLPEPTKSKRKVLIVEDEPNIRQLAIKALEKAGYETLEAADGQVGWETIQKEHDSLAAVILDLTLPAIDGLKVLQSLREINIDLPVVVISGCSEREAAPELANMRRTYYLQKPFRSQELVTRVSQLTLARQA
jgi:PAS domain S-box-containing protein